MSRNTISAFLAAARTALATPKSYTRSNPLTFVVGNESADLDSLCTALIYAYVQTHTPPFTLHVPLANLARDDLRLRPELGFALSKARVRTEELITLEDLPWLGAEGNVPQSGDAASNSTPPSLLPTEAANFILVDHNALTGVLAKQYASAAIGCIDHHEDEGVIPTPPPGVPRIITKAGSCMSLVVDYCRAFSSLSEGSPRTDLAYLALAPILIDTNRLKSKSKVEDVDVRAVASLERLLLSNDTDTDQEDGPTEPYDRNTYFKHLQNLKEDIGALSIHDILRKDYKSFAENGMILGMSTVIKELAFLCRKAGSRTALDGEITRFAKERGLSLFAIMTTTGRGQEFKRELLLRAFDGRGARAVRVFESGESEELELRRLTVSMGGNEGGSGEIGGENGDLTASRADGGDGDVWIQQRLDASRKQVGPMLRRAMNGI